MLFEGQTGSDFGLWLTVGTPAGTVQLTPITGANANFRPSDLTVFGAEVLFNGTDTGGHASLWKTSGTAATTSEITGIAGPAAAAGLDPSDLTVVNGKVLFNGNDSRSNTAARAVSGLWETDGTGAGTIEFIGLGLEAIRPMADWTPGTSPPLALAPCSSPRTPAPAAPSDCGSGTASTPTTAKEVTVAGANSLGLLPNALTDLNGVALFNGLDTDGNPGLFEFDVTTGPGAS